VSLRFQADADLNQVIVLGLLRREPAVDFKTATEADLEGVPDPDVLALAAAEGRILVSHDLRSMPDHFATFVQTATSPGVFLIPQHLPVAVALEELLLLWSATEPSEWINQIVWLPLT